MRLILLLALLMVACAQTRDPVPVSLKSQADNTMTCEQMEVEYQTNTSVARKKIAKNIDGDERDLLVGFFIWPGLADFKNADGTEGNALLDRNVYLRTLAVEKDCRRVGAWPEQPERYK